MMSRSSNSIDPYNSSTMFFPGGLLDSFPQQRPQQVSNTSWDYFHDSTSTDMHGHFYDYSPAEAAPALSFGCSNDGGALYPAAMEEEYGMYVEVKRELEGSIGLNLGQRTYFQTAMNRDPALQPVLHGGGVNYYHHHVSPPWCHAEGCKADLSTAKHYHRRHKVCEFHSKAAVVVVNGIHQRFCQQCSRFHVLDEFDEAKRSCRKRLADHNRRRRKPQLSSTSTIDHHDNPKTSIVGTSKTKSYKESKISKASSSTPLMASASSTSCTTMTIASSIFEGYECKPITHDPQMNISNAGPGLSLGGIEDMKMESFSRGVADHDPSINGYFRHHNLFCSSSNGELSNSTVGPDETQQNSKSGNNNMVFE